MCSQLATARPLSGGVRVSVNSLKDRSSSESSTSELKTIFSRAMDAQALSITWLANQTPSGHVVSTLSVPSGFQRKRNIMPWAGLGGDCELEWRSTGEVGYLIARRESSSRA